MYIVDPFFGKGLTSKHAEPHDCPNPQGRSEHPVTYTSLQFNIPTPCEDCPLSTIPQVTILHLAYSLGCCLKRRLSTVQPGADHLAKMKQERGMLEVERWRKIAKSNCACASVDDVSRSRHRVTWNAVQTVLRGNSEGNSISLRENARGYIQVGRYPVYSIPIPDDNWVIDIVPSFRLSVTSGSLPVTFRQVPCRSATAL